MVCLFLVIPTITRCFHSECIHGACICMCICVRAVQAPRPCNGDDASPLKRNDSQSGKKEPICHLMQSLLTLQQEPHTGIDYKQDDISLWAASRIIINKCHSL